MVRLQRSLVMPCMCCLGPQVSNRTMPPARSIALWRWMNTHKHSASAGKKRRSRWEYTHRCSCRTSDRWQFWWRPLLRLHSLWRYHQHRGAAGSCEQATRHPHLRQRNRRGKGKGLPRSSGGGPFTEGQVGGPARLRAPSGRAIRRALDEELPGGICQTGIRRAGRNRGIRRACW